ncbi:MAG: TerD family protein [Lachnospiraceae bacterium]|nr:TerD family protein [Lachnospiraceae bacterium]
MKNIYRNYLFDKHLFVSEGDQKENENAFEVAFALANLFNIKIVKGEKLLKNYMIKLASKCLGEDVPDPFYKGFPDSVRELSADQLLFDQLVHYTVTYGFGNFSEAGHSLFEEKFERAAFKENADIKTFSVITEEEAVLVLSDVVNDLLAGTRPLSDTQYELVKSYIMDYNFVIEDVASKNTCIRLFLDTRNMIFTDFMSLSDVIRLVDELNYQAYENKDIKKLNLKNQDRKFITLVIDNLIASGRCDIRNCYEKKKYWNGLLHHIHYKAKSIEAEKFLSAMRGEENLSVYSEFEKAMAAKNIKAAVDALKSGKGSAAVLRNMNYIISRCESISDMEYILSSMDTKNVIVLIQLLIQYSQYKNSAAARNFKFTKYNMMKVHTETEEEMRKRKSIISEGQAKMLASKIGENLKTVLKGRLGKVYIDPDMRNYALPIQENTAQSGYGVLTKGSRLHIPEAKKLRGFTYWEKVNDIDLSVFGIDENGNRKEFSWRTMVKNQSAAITYSGDETSGFNGGSEYFDIDLNAFRKMYPDMRYLIFCDNVYSGLPFDKCFCKAGYMIRDVEDSGEIYEPKTVKSSFVVDCNSTFAYLFGVDLVSNDFIWLNIARDGSTQVAGTTGMDFLTDYFHVTDIINVHSFFEMMATEIVDDPSKAEIVVTDKNIECAEGVEVIREYDTERMIALMN